ncbi:MAG: hypothetical protein LW708_08995 [Anabaena sp. 49628_E55]|nr:hypothetical protein [Anabaena sp. 49628_E55]
MQYIKQLRSRNLDPNGFLILSLYLTQVHICTCVVREQVTGNREQGTGNREQGTGNTGRKTELILTESCMTTPRKLSKIK